MSENYERTAAWLKACGKEPNAANFSLQLGCHIEEFVEMFEGLELELAANTTPQEKQNALENITGALWMIGNFADALKNGALYIRVNDRENFLDALCDMEVTGNGVAYLGGFNKPPADEAVLYANERKLVDGKPVILANGKIGKPKGWVAPDLSAFV